MTGCFDDAVFEQSAAPAPTATPTPVVATSTGATTAVVATATPMGAGAAPNNPGIAPQQFGPVGQANAGPATLRITEVMSDPIEPGRDAAFEWVEILNTGDAAIDLAGWRIEDGTRGDMLPAALILPGAYAVIAGASAVFEPSVQVMRVADGEIGNGLANNGDLLRLVHPDGTVVDAMSFGENASVFADGPEAPGAGVTVGVIDPDVADDAANWALTLRPTPGEANVFPEPEEAVEGAATPGRAPASAAGTQDQPEPVPFAGVQVDDDDGDGGSIAPWLILGGLAGISVGAVYAAFAPRIKKWWVARRGR